MKLIGSVEIDFEDLESGYSIVYGGWSPTVAQLRDDVLAGSPYGDCTESIAIQVEAKSKSDLELRLNVLVMVLHEAERFGRTGRGQAAVVEENDKQSLITRIINITMPPYEPNELAVAPIQVEFTRRGGWLRTEFDDSSEAIGAGIQSLVFEEAHDLRSPIDLRLMLMAVGGYQPFPSGILIVSHDAARISHDSIDSGSGSMNANSSAYHGNIMHWSSVGAAPAPKFFRAGNVPESLDKRDLIFIATIRCTGAIAARPYAEINGTAIYGRWTLLPATGKPSPVVIGRLSSVNEGLSNIGVEIVAGEGEMIFEIDTLTLIAADDETYVIQLDAVNGGVLRAPNALRLQQMSLSRLIPQYSLTTPDWIGSYRGNAHVYVAGDSVSCLWLACYDDDWQIMYGSNPALIALSAQRRRVYLIP